MLISLSEGRSLLILCEAKRDNEYYCLNPQVARMKMEENCWVAKKQILMACNCCKTCLSISYFITEWNRVPACISTIVENESLFWGDVDDKTSSMLNGRVQFIVKVRDIILEPNQNWIQVIPNTLNEALEYQSTGTKIMTPKIFLKW